MIGAPIQARVLNALTLTRSKIVSIDELICAAYPEPDSEPESARNIICISVFALRERGHKIKNHHGRGYSYDD